MPWVSDEEWARVSALEPASAGSLRLPNNTNLSLDSKTEIPAVEPIQGGQTGVPACTSPPPFAFVSASTGVVVEARCGRLYCPGCCLLKARARALAISYARPERSILLTDAGNDFATISARVNRVRYDIVKETGKSFEMVYSVEPNPSEDGRNHLHAWQHGSYVDQRLLSSIAARRGLGEVARISKIRSTVGASRYGLKGLGYGLKGAAELGEAQRAFLSLNGKRLTHQTRGFFRDPDGASIPVRQAEQQARAATQPKDPGPWILTAL